jgi:acylphosphatase
MVKKLMSENVFNLNCWFEGHVQGVGFRYQTLNVAKGFQVTGTVKNLADGRVHLYAEGEAGEVNDFLRELKDELKSYIKDSAQVTNMGPRVCKSFTINN